MHLTDTQASPPTSLSPSLEALLEKRRSFLAFVQRRVNDLALAEDIVQSAYLRALAARTAPPAEETSAVTWFYAVLRHAVVDHFRRRATEQKHIDSDGDFDPDQVPVIPTDPHEFVCRCVEHVLPALRPAYAEIIRDVDLGEQGLTAFASAHGLTPANAAVRAHRARKALREALMAFCGACSTHACLQCDCAATTGQPH